MLTKPCWKRTDADASVNSKEQSLTVSFAAGNSSKLYVNKIKVKIVVEEGFDKEFRRKE